MKFGIPIYEDVYLLDVAGPLEMYHWAGRNGPLELVLISMGGRSVTSLNGVRFEAQASFADMPAFESRWISRIDLNTPDQDVELNRLLFGPGRNVPTEPHSNGQAAADDIASWID